MKRRRFIAALCSAAAWPRVARSRSSPNSCGASSRSYHEAPTRSDALAPKHPISEHSNKGLLWGRATNITPIFNQRGVINGPSRP